MEISIKPVEKSQSVQDKKPMFLPASRKSEEIDWVNVAFLTITPLVAVVGIPLHLLYTGLTWPIIGIFVFYLLATGLSITGVYHRLFAHKSYEANSLVKILFLIFGAAACQNSAL